MPKDTITILSGTPEQCVEFDPAAYCWRQRWWSRFESIWSLLRKFAYANAINHCELQRSLGNKSVSHKRDHWRWKSRADLRSLGSLDPTKLSRIFQVDLESLAEATVVPFVRPHEVSLLACESLRFCLTCIGQGFHSSLHQLLLLKSCPVHGEPLVTRCPQCGGAALPYELGFIAREQVSKCKHITPRLLSSLRGGGELDSNPDAAARERGLLTVAEWLRKRVGLNTAEQPLWRGIDRMFEERLRCQLLRRLPSYWSDILESDVPSCCPDTSANATHGSIKVHAPKPKIRAISARGESSSRQVIDDEWYLELYRIYKSIRRRLGKTYLRPHRRCAVNLARYVWWDSFMTTMKGVVCAPANALLIWRMHCEGLIKPDMLFQPYRSNRNALLQHVDWSPPDVNLPKHVLRRIFALDCLGLFYEAVLVADFLRRRRLYSLRRDQLKGRRIPYWIVKTDGSNHVIHWWFPKALTAVLRLRPKTAEVNKAAECPYQMPVVILEERRGRKKPKKTQ